MKKRKLIIVGCLLLCGALVCMLITNILFKIKTGGIFSAEWSAGDTLNYIAAIAGGISTFMLGYIRILEK